MTKEKEIEVAIKQLMNVCEKHEVSITGAIDDNDLGLCAFENLSKKTDVTEGFFNMLTLIQQRGDIGSFLCELSRIDSKGQPFAESLVDDQAALFAQSNNQIYSTFH